MNKVFLNFNLPKRFMIPIKRASAKQPTKTHGNNKKKSEVGKNLGFHTVFIPCVSSTLCVIMLWHFSPGPHKSPPPSCAPRA